MDSDEGIHRSINYPQHVFYTSYFVPKLALLLSTLALDGVDALPVLPGRRPETATIGLSLHSIPA